jgi:hypothetical protein
MLQTRLERYFKSSPVPHVPSLGCSFLDLPYSVRKLIYYYAEVTDGALYDLNYMGLEYHFRDVDTGEATKHRLNYFPVIFFPYVV